MYMEKIMSLIELDEYLNLDIEPLHEEFMNVVDTIPKKYWNMFYSNTDKYGVFKDDSPEVQTIYLTDLTGGDYEGKDYFLIDKGGYWVDLPIFDEFPKIKKMVSELPFEHTGRIMLIFSKVGEEIVSHFDHDWKDWRHEFIWIRFNKNKSIFVDNTYIQGNTCWFDSQKVHGTKSDGYSISMRIDGKYKSDFRDKLFGNNSEWKTITEDDYNEIS